MPGKNPLDKKGVLDTLPKFKMILDPQSYRMVHPVYRLKDIQSVQHYHHEPETKSDRFALFLVKFFRGGMDFASRYNPEKMTERNWLNRAVFLETVAGVPGMIGGMSRHLKSLRTMEHDNGWIHHLLQEAENERMHLFIFLTMRNPGIIFRVLIAGAQGFFLNFYILFYMISPKTAHRFVGYLEEEAVYTYNVVVKAIDDGTLL